MPSSSSSPVKLLFLLAVILNGLLWSQSRYAQFQQHQSQASLVRRVSEELLNPSNVSVSEKQCRPLAYPVTEQCMHVRTHCPKPATFLSIHYLERYFCTSLPLRYLAFCTLLTWLVFLFSTLGISASDFFTPNLATIAHILGLDDNVAGVTFLAFGNGSPDVFSTFSAMRANSGSLAIGELLGAATFIVSCVVGSMCVIKPFHVLPGPFLRDVGFFTIAVSMLLFSLWDGKIHAWEAGSLVGLYLLYVFVVVVGSWRERRQRARQEHEALIRAEYQDEELPAQSFNEPYRDQPPSTLTVPTAIPQRTRPISTPTRPHIQTDVPRRPHSRHPSPTPSMHAQIPSFSLVGALEFSQVISSLRDQAAGTALSMFESPVTPYAGGHYHAHPATRGRTPRTSLTSHDGNVWDTALQGLQLDERTGRPRSTASTILSPVVSPGEQSGEQGQAGTSSGDFLHPSSGYGTPGTHSPTPVPSILYTPASPTASDAESDTQLYMPQTRREKLMGIADRLFRALFPSLYHFHELSVLGQVAAVFAAPAVLCLNLTLPVVVSPCIDADAAREKVLGGGSVTGAGEGRLVDFEEEGEERVLIAEEEVLEEMHELAFNKWLMAAQCALAPLFCMGVLFHGAKHQVWLLIAAAVVGVTVAGLVIIFAEKGDHPTARMARCSMGFVVAIMWIMAIADEVVNVLQTFGFVFGLSDAIIGLTIFAVGNSLADLVANMSVAVFAPIMGFSACFGGPMLNMLLGVGMSGSYVIQQTGKPYDLEFSTTLLVSTVGLLALLATTLLVIPLNGYFLSRKWGVLLIASYTVLMTINVVVELHRESR